MASLPRPRLAALGFAGALLIALIAPTGASAADHALTITTEGPGSGTVQCEVNGGPPGPCATQYEAGAEVAVTAEPDPGSELLEFGGDCGPLYCEVEMNEDHLVSVFFEGQSSYVPLQVVPTGGGFGEVLCEVEGTRGECEDEYEAGTEVTLIAEADAGSEFSEWGGDCEGSPGSECELKMDSGKEVEADFELSTGSFALTIEQSGEGEVICEAEEGPEPCKGAYPEGAVLYLIAQASPGSEFLTWEGECKRVQANECKVEVDAPRTVKARFKREAPTEYKLTVSKTGSGSGTVTSSPAGINCGTGAGCEHEYEEGTEVTLSQVASSGSEFKEWGGACTGSGACKVTMSEAKSVTAKFTRSYKLTVSKTGAGSGTVTSSPAGINCGSGASCEHEYEEGTEVTLSPSASSGSEFKEWGGACSGSGTCKVTMNEAKNVTAKFEPIPKPKFKLTVSKLGGGSGTITSTPSGINCGTGAGCEAEFEEGTEVELHESPTTGTFKEWGGACSGSGTCKVTMSAAKSVTAKFVKSYKLTVSKTGTGSGTVTSSPAGINCGTGAGCEHEYEEGTEVTLSPSAASGSEFIEWGGACTGTGTCKVTMSEAKSVSARFEPEPPPPPPFLPLTVAKTGAGQGTVTSTPAGIDCGAVCSFEFEKATTVELRQEASPGSEFIEWGGACSGSGNCRVKINLAKEVTARFEPAPTPRFSLTIQISGTGSGTVSCDAGACAATYAQGSEVTLTASPASGSDFSGWSGACSGTGPCTVRIDSDTTVGASFAKSPEEPPTETPGEATSPYNKAPYRDPNALIALACPGPGRCTGVINLTVKLSRLTHHRHAKRNARRHHKRSSRLLIGSAPFDIAPATTETVPVKITSAKARRLLSGGGNLVVVLSGTEVQPRALLIKGARRGRSHHR